MKTLPLFIIFSTIFHHANSLDTVGKILKVFDLDFDDVVVEKGENWVEKYYIK